MTANHLAIAHFVLVPIALLCLQYGWDLIVEDLVPMSRAQILKRALMDGSWEDE